MRLDRNLWPFWFVVVLDFRLNSITVLDKIGALSFRTFDTAHEYAYDIRAN